jgi:macrolide-specific efflux system membrane fusion protein
MQVSVSMLPLLLPYFYLTLMEVKQIKLAKPPPRRTSFSLKWFIPVFALALVLANGLYLWSIRPRAPVVVAPAPIQFKTVQVQRADIEQTVFATGKLQLFRYVDMGPQISGNINNVDIALGDDVKAGKLLFKIEPNVSIARLQANQAQLAGLRAELTEQQVQLEFADLQFKRQTQLKAENATREETFESSRAAMFSAAARLEAIKAHIRETESATKDDEEARKHTDVTAPFSGTIVALSVRPGQTVVAHQQTQALARIADLSKLTVQARVAELDVPQLHKGINVYFATPGYHDKRWYGSVRQIVPVPADGSGDQGKDAFYNVLFEVANPDRQLLSGMSAEVHFVISHIHDAATLPAGILGKPDSDGLYSVKILDANRLPQPRKIRVGIRNANQVQILSGLAPGERLIVDAPAASASSQSSQSTMAGDKKIPEISSAPHHLPD